jgi:monoamine oxidase
VEVQTRAGEAFVAGAAIVAVALNALGGIEFSPSLPEDKRKAIDVGQASRGVKVMIHARGEGMSQNSLRFLHPFGYLSSEILRDDGTQLMIGFGGDAERCDPADLAGMQVSLDETLPGYEVLDATAHDWLADEFSRGTWAIHRPGWYERHHAAMRRPEGNVMLAGSDLANGWAGFMDGAIESGLHAGAWALALD